MLTIAIRAARAAGNIIVRSMDRIDELTIKSKQPNDFVSEIDHKAESEIIRTIHKSYPKHAILAEESGAQGQNEYEWIIDPLDGTTNFLHGFPQFAVSIALRKQGELEVAVVYDPLSQELYTAVKGGGAQLNGKRIRVSKRIHLNGALLATGFPFKENQNIDHYLSTLKRMMLKTTGIRRAGSAALDLAYTAAGRVDGFWEMGLNTWDIAAGILLIKEAGGIISDLSGGSNYFNTGNILCGNPKIHQQMVKEFNDLTSTA